LWTWSTLAEQLTDWLHSASHSVVIGGFLSPLAAFLVPLVMESR